MCPKAKLKLKITSQSTPFASSAVPSVNRVCVDEESLSPILDDSERRLPSIGERSMSSVSLPEEGVDSDRLESAGRPNKTRKMSKSLDLLCDFDPLSGPRLVEKQTDADNPAVGIGGFFRGDSDVLIELSDENSAASLNETEKSGRSEESEPSPEYSAITVKSVDENLERPTGSDRVARAPETIETDNSVPLQSNSLDSSLSDVEVPVCENGYDHPKECSTGTAEDGLWSERLMSQS